MASLLVRPITFEITGDPEVPYATSLDGRRVQVRLNDADDADELYTVLVDGDEVERFSDWPAAWVRPDESELSSAS
jgi:hypothetical protein